MLDTLGNSTGKTIPGAVTIELTQPQVDRAAQGPSHLWAQGGTPTDPVMNEPHPGEYGFAALRCSADNLNGDNVEWITFSSGMKHAYCYAYYVKPPPTSATVIVKKHLVGAPAGMTQRFRFKGSISYASDDSFDINASSATDGSISFYRGETNPSGSPWTFAEQPSPNFELSATDPNAIVCESTGGSKWTIDRSTAEVSINTLVAGDTVTCTYSNTYVEPPGGLAIEKLSIGGTGTFSWLVSPLFGGSPLSTSATTLDEVTPAAAKPQLSSILAGTYRMVERQQVRDDGSWSLASVTCNGDPLSITQPLDVTVNGGASVLCVFTNKFTPKGRISLRKVTYGSTGSVAFEAQGPDSDSAVKTGSATTTAEGASVFATGDYHDFTELGHYSVTEAAAAPTPGGSWKLSSVTCDGAPVPAAQGQIEIELTKTSPLRDCTFVNTFTKTEVNPEPPNPNPDGPLARISVSKRTLNPRVHVGG